MITLPIAQLQLNFHQRCPGPRTPSPNSSPAAAAATSSDYSEQLPSADFHLSTGVPPPALSPGTDTSACANTKQQHTLVTALHPALYTVYSGGSGTDGCGLIAAHLDALEGNEDSVTRLARSQVMHFNAACLSSQTGLNTPAVCRDRVFGPRQLGMQSMLSCGAA